MTPEHAIAILNVAALAAIMLSMGLQVTLASVLASLRPIRLVALGIVANFVFIPLAALAVLSLFHANPMVTVGFFILAVCPGAPVGPPFAAVARGNVSLAIALMVLLAGLSAVLAPALLGLLLNRVLPDSEIRLDYVAIAKTLLILQILPLVIGFAIHRASPKWTAKMAQPVEVLSKLLMVLLLGSILWAQYPMLADIRARGWVGMGLLLATSWLIGWLCGGSRIDNRKALIVTAGPRNAAVGLVIAGSNFANTPVMTAVVAYGLVSMIGTLGCAFLLARITATKDQ